MKKKTSIAIDFNQILGGLDFFGTLNPEKSNIISIAINLNNLNFLIAHKEEYDFRILLREDETLAEARQWIDEYLYFDDIQVQLIRKEDDSSVEADFVISKDFELLERVKGKSVYPYGIVRKKRYPKGIIAISEFEQLLEVLKPEGNINKVPIETRTDKIMSYYNLKKIWKYMEQNPKNKIFSEELLDGVFHILEDYVVMAILDEMFLEEDRGSDYYYEGIHILLPETIKAYLQVYNKESIIESGFALFLQGGKTYAHDSREWKEICQFMLNRKMRTKHDFITKCFSILDASEHWTWRRDELKFILDCYQYYNKAMNLDEEVLNMKEKEAQMFIEQVLQYQPINFGQRKLGELKCKKSLLS